MLLTIAATCLALNVYHEARSENMAGQYAVALVTMNRAGQDIDKVCHEVLKPKQFSWTNKLVVRKGKSATLAAAGKPKDSYAYQRAVIVAREVLTGRVADFTHGSTHYHTQAVHPVWRRSMMATKQVGHHIFYRNA